MTNPSARSKKPRKSARVNSRKIYEDHYGKIKEKGLDVHHILPKRLGGTDDVSNLIPLSRPDHAIAHKLLYEKYGDTRDLQAYYMLTGDFENGSFYNASRGGLAATKAFKERGQPLGFQAFDKQYLKEVASKAGKIGGTKARDTKIGIHAQTREERLAFCSMGGTKSCETNGWRDPKVQSRNGKKGGVKNAGSICINDGEHEFRYTKKQQAEESIDDYLSRTGLVRGRLHIPLLTCPHCLTTGIHLNLKRWHFDKCKQRKTDENKENN